MRDRKEKPFTLSLGCDDSSAAPGSSAIGAGTTSSSPVTASEASCSRESVKFVSLRSLRKRPVKVGTRKSPLAIAQVEEVLQEIREFESQVQFEVIKVDTYGDKDRKTSLRLLDRTDFFTREIDQLLLKGGCRIAVHSAKDLPSPLPKGLQIVAITKGVDPSDSLVLPEGVCLTELPTGAVIATSSKRREESVKALRSDFTFVDIRGTIQERLEMLHTKKIDGVVIAEAALIRLRLNPNRVSLLGETAPLQGKLAILSREGDDEMSMLFFPIHQVVF